MRRIMVLCIVLVILLLSISHVSAKNLTSQAALGFNTQVSQNNVDSISFKYWPTSRIAFQASFGLVMSDPQDEFDLGFKLIYKVKDEQNMYAYTGGGIGISNVDPDPGDSDTTLGLSAFVGIEYFFSGLPNLGFSTELGLKVIESDAYDAFGIDADTFLTAGLHYYFSGR